MFMKKTVDGIAAQFHKMVADLEGVIEHAESEAKRHAEIANQAIRKQAEHLEERAKASKLATKIRELLS